MTICAMICAHGGLCTLDTGHQGPHIAGSLFGAHCSWEGEDQMTREEADALLCIQGFSDLVTLTDDIEKSDDTN